jgi:4-hydroxy-4-methyl-2-oxoglutarate aldolase
MTRKADSMSDTALRTAPDQGLRSKLDRVSCSALLDALLDRYAHPSHILDLVSPTPGRVLFGPAVTIRFVPTRSDLSHPVQNNFASNFYRAIGESGEGAVLVMSSGGHADAALGGGRKLSRLRHNGLAGVLADGRLRDFDALAGYEFATYCKGETVRQGGNLVMPLEANVPVEVSGVTVVPGDYVYADASGAVIVPSGVMEEVFQDAAAREVRDAASADRMKQEDPAQVMAKGEVRG